MHRGFSADCTMPCSVCLIASAGHTSAQVGSSQCMHTIGAVACVVAAVDRLEVDERRPRCVPHSSHACTHAWQPMHRLWSITNTGVSSDAERSSDVRPSRPAPAATLNSGMCDVGSTARMVSWFGGLSRRASGRG